MAPSDPESSRPARETSKRVPAGATQHRTAGPYSPVIEVDATRLVVLSGQVAVDLDGSVIGDTIEEQTRATLDNCRRQLAIAGCTFADVFKVNVYLADLADWARFNSVYEQAFADAASGSHRRPGRAHRPLPRRDRDVGGEALRGELSAPRLTWPWQAPSSFEQEGSIR